MLRQLNVCSVCGITGKDGANYVLHADDMQSRTVHKYCGEQAVAKAPEGVKAKVVPSRELLDRRRTERNVRSFWAEKFAQAKPIRNDVSSAALLLGEP